MITTQSLLKEYQRLKKENTALLEQANELKKALDFKENENTHLSTKLDNLLEQIKLMNQRKFAASSEANILQQNFI